MDSILFFDGTGMGHPCSEVFRVGNEYGTLEILEVPWGSPYSSQVEKINVVFKENFYYQFVIGKTPFPSMEIVGRIKRDDERFFFHSVGRLFL